MRIVKDSIWTLLMPDTARENDRRIWTRSGGKWIVFDREERIKEIAEKLAPHIDSGEIESGKYWNGDPSALNVYSLDRDREKTRKILQDLGALRAMVWEYDYAWRKNLRSPFTFTYSWLSKFKTIVQSRGICGALRLVRRC
ncbi:MAG TPA: hypothetical protein VL087_02970 [Nitrospirota bacterium]|nr:hypothetical protein [Nitrospirota bacterium]